MLVKLLGGFPSSIRSSVIVLRNKGPLAKDIEALGIEVYALGLGYGKYSVRNIWQLLKYVRRFRPSLVQGWMYHGNIVAWLIAKTITPKPKLIWNIRQTLYTIKAEKPMTHALIRFGALISRAPERIIYNTRLSAQHHEQKGFNAQARVIIANGFDVNIFLPDRSARRDIRQRLSIPSSMRIVGHIARFHPMKDHIGFLQAASIVADKIKDIHFVLAGRNVVSTNPQFATILCKPSLRGRVTLLGERADIPKLMAGFDIFVMSSAWGEGFPNVVGEAMACAVPCVVTDIGASADIVGDYGCVVRPKDHEALGEAMIDMLAIERRELMELGKKAQARIKRHFSQEQIREIYVNLYREIA